VIAVTVVALMALSAAAVETGHIFYAYRLLQASTNAATLAAGEAMPYIGASGDGANAATAWGNLAHYSSQAGGLNASPLLAPVSITPNFYCSSTLEGDPYLLPCYTPASGSCTGASTCNALKVTQTARVNLWFAGMLGIPNMTISSTAYAAMRGKTALPYNIAVIMDTTSSMNDPSNKNDACGGETQIQCAVAGLQTMLGIMDPCPQGESCTSNPKYVDDVALFVFPALALNTTQTNYSNDYCTKGGDPSVPYNFIDVTPTGTPAIPTNANMQSTAGATNAGTYWIIPFLNDYRQNDELTTGLNSASYLVKAVGVGCSPGLTAPGQQGTYYAQVIYTAQSALAAAKSANKGSQNVMIILSDGNANACSSQANTTGGGCNSSSQIVADNCPTINGTSSSAPCIVVKNSKGVVTQNYWGNPLNGTQTSTIKPTGYQSPTYPSALGQCGQAVQAAQTATAAGTMVYTVSMGSPTTSSSSNCGTDRYYSTKSSYWGGTWNVGGNPCTAIQAMASDATKFYSDAQNGCSASGDNAKTTFQSIANIMTAIGYSLTTARLIPNGTQ
jgi:hypothetical protein